MTAPEDEPRIVTTDTAEVRAIFNSLSLMGALDDCDIYEIVKPDGRTEQLQLGGGLQYFSDLIIRQSYPDCVVTLVSLWEAKES